MDRWEFFQNSKGLWRWRCTSADGNVVLNSAGVYPLRRQAVADAITHGFADGAGETDLDGAPEADPVAATDHLQALKLEYESAFSASKARPFSDLSLAVSSSASNGLREDVVIALHALEYARREYREALLQTAFGGAAPERWPTQPPSAETALRELRLRYSAAHAAYRSCVHALNEAVASEKEPSLESMEKEAAASRELTEARAHLLAAIAKDTSRLPREDHST